MPLIVYLDETGDHSLEKIDAQFPVFVLVFFVVDTADYCSKIVPAVTALKFKHVGHDGAVLHSSDIRRERNDFVFLRHPEKRASFMTDVDTLMESLPYSVIAVAIDKAKHKQRYGPQSRNPYELALEYGMERLKWRLDAAAQTEVCMIAESRGKVEDDALRAAFFTLLQKGTQYHSFRHLTIRLEFVKKERNVIGLQLADLIAYPIGKFVITGKLSAPMRIIFPKFQQGTAWRHGFKVFPS
jgi:hypothetical protein